MKVGAQAFEKPKKIFNIDNTENKSGSITHFIDLKVQTKGEVKDMRFLIADIGTENLLLGYPWLATFEPGFKWRPAIMDSINFPVIISSSIPSPAKTIIAMLTTKEREDIVTQLEGQCTIRGIATELAIQAGEGKKKVEIPPQYNKFKRLFSEEASHHFPPKRAWDHAIDFKLDTPDVIDCKVYPMTQTEDKAMKDFIKEQHAKGISAHRNRLMHPPSSLSKRGMGNYDQYKTTGELTITPSAINIPYPSYPSLRQILATPTSSQN